MNSEYTPRIGDHVRVVKTYGIPPDKMVGQTGKIVVITEEYVGVLFDTKFYSTLHNLYRNFRRDIVRELSREEMFEETRSNWRLKLDYPNKGWFIPRTGGFLELAYKEIPYDPTQQGDQEDDI